MPRLVVSMATTPDRIGLTENTINSILNQTVSPDVMYINLPHKCRRSNSEYIIPDFISLNPKIVVNRFECDMGPSNKLLPILNLEQDPETMVITIDDDLTFAKHMIEMMLDELDGRDIIISNTVWTVRAFLDRVSNEDSLILLKSLSEDLLNNRVSATGSGALFKIKFFDNYDPTIFYPDEYYYGNDLFFSLLTSSVDKLELSKKCYKHLNYGYKSDSLSVSGSNKHNYIKILNHVTGIGYVTEGDMKRSLMDCPFFDKYKHCYKDSVVLPITIPSIDLDLYDNLMIVAHPDDEVIFGGNDLISSKNWLVVVCSNDFSRIDSLKRVSSYLHFDYLLLDHIDSQIKNLRFHQSIVNIINFIVTMSSWNKIVTHNINGEYGHIQHIITHKMVSTIVNSTGKDNLFTFDDNKKTKLQDDEINIKKNALLMYNRPPNRWPQLNYYISKHTKVHGYGFNEFSCFVEKKS